MRKIFLVLLTFVLASSMVFGYKLSGGVHEMLYDPNQFTVGLDRIGILAGTENIRFLAGLNSANSGLIFDNLSSSLNPDDYNTAGVTSKNRNSLYPAAIAAVAYTTKAFGVGVGYQFQINNKKEWITHTPILTFKIVNEDLGDLRVNIPISIGLGAKAKDVYKSSTEGTSAVSGQVFFRYYPKSKIFVQSRLWLEFGMYSAKEVTAEAGVLSGSVRTTEQAKDLGASSFGFEWRNYFDVYNIEGPVRISPWLRIVYQMAIQNRNMGYTDANGNDVEIGSYSIRAGSAILNEDFRGGYVPLVKDLTRKGVFLKDPKVLGIAVPITFIGNPSFFKFFGNATNFINIKFEPALSFAMITGSERYDFDDSPPAGVNEYSLSENPKTLYSLGYTFFVELFITPIPELVLILEIQTGGVTSTYGLGTGKPTEMIFNGNTRFIYYF